MTAKLMIIDYYDSLIQQVDIYTEEQLGKYTEESVITFDDSDLDRSDSNEEEETPDFLDLESQNTTINQIISYNPYWKRSEYKYPKEKAKHEPSELSTNVHKFLNNIREEMIRELKKGQEEALKYYEKIKSEVKVDKLASEEEMDRKINAKLFENQIMLLVLDKNSKSTNGNSPFKLYLIVLDFYLNRHERHLLK